MRVYIVYIIIAIYVKKPTIYLAIATNMRQFFIQNNYKYFTMLEMTL